jgi:hypothetical protein
MDYFDSGHFDSRTVIYTFPGFRYSYQANVISLLGETSDKQHRFMGPRVVIEINYTPNRSEKGPIELN